MSSSTITSETFPQWLDDGRELAVLDIRPAAEVAYYGQPLFGTNVPHDVPPDRIDQAAPRRECVRCWSTGATTAPAS